MAQAATAPRPASKPVRPTATVKPASGKAVNDPGAAWTYSSKHMLILYAGIALIVASFALMKYGGDISISPVVLWIAYTIIIPFALLWDPDKATSLDDDAHIAPSAVEPVSDAS